MGVSYAPEKPFHHRLVADLIFANSSQWTEFQLSRRGNPGLVRGSIWFLGMSLYQTYRGLVYLGRHLTSREPATLARQAQQAQQAKGTA